MADIHIERRRLETIVIPANHGANWPMLLALAFMASFWSGAAYLIFG